MKPEPLWCSLVRPGAEAWLLLDRSAVEVDRRNSRRTAMLRGWRGGGGGEGKATGVVVRVAKWVAMVHVGR